MMFLKDTLYSEKDRSDFGFLVVLFVLMVLSFLLFYFGIPLLTDIFIEAQASSSVSPVV